MADHSRRRKALADATAGVVASLISLWAFYPMDVLKTNVQANKTKGQAMKELSSFRGLPIKTLHTASSNFCYFYISSWLQRWWMKRQKENDKMSTIARLTLSAVAAVLNTCLTLPLDVLSAQQQTGCSEKPTLTTNRLQWQNTETTACCSNSSLMDNAWRAVQEEEIFFDTNDEEEEEKKDDSIVFADPSFVNSSRQEYQEEPPLQVQPRQEPSSLWKGLWPSLLLCSNPSIHYTVFDLLKSRLLSGSKSERLSMRQAFVLGLLAKFSATLSTYPLIRAKIMLMTTNRTSLLGCLVQEYNRDGLRAWYSGIELQLSHTLLKSALLLMVKEGLTASVHKLLVPTTPAQVKR